MKTVVTSFHFELLLVSGFQAAAILRFGHGSDGGVGRQEDGLAVDDDVSSCSSVSSSSWLMRWRGWLPWHLPTPPSWVVGRTQVALSDFNPPEIRFRPVKHKVVTTKIKVGNSYYRLSLYSAMRVWSQTKVASSLIWSTVRSWNYFGIGSYCA
jgi:hypothetical protein